jgi:hypothetical protein
VIELLNKDYRAWQNRISTTHPSRAGSLGWEARTKWVNDTVEVDVAPPLQTDKRGILTEGTAKALRSYDVPSRLGLNRAPSMLEQLGSGCELMGCGAKGGIGQMAQEHVEFHYRGKNIRSTRNIDVVDTNYLRQAQEVLAGGGLALSDLVPREYPSAPHHQMKLANAKSGQHLS